MEKVEGNKPKTNILEADKIEDNQPFFQIEVGS